MSLAALQQEFIAHLADEDRALPPRWDSRMGAGLAIYRNAYRNRLIDALRETFPRTAKWIGEDTFAQAAAHHLIANPSRSWTLDMAGDGFAETLASLFRQDAEVAELAWLEWAMHLAFTAADTPSLDSSGFAAATATFGEADWDTLQLSFVAGLSQRAVSSDCVALWQALAGEPPAHPPRLADAGAICVVWRVGFEPLCEIWPVAKASVLADFIDGNSLSAICHRLSAVMPPEKAVQCAGETLSKIIAYGMAHRVA